jgi:transglutaminase-like putative cysteine protease
LEAELERGETVEALCGTQAHLAVRELRRQGLTARSVGALREPYGPDNSHVMLEVRVGGAWQCYDVMGNT